MKSSAMLGDRLCMNRTKAAFFCASKQPLGEEAKSLFRSDSVLSWPRANLVMRIIHSTSEISWDCHLQSIKMIWIVSITYYNLWNSVTFHTQCILSIQTQCILPVVEFPSVTSAFFKSAEWKWYGTAGIIIPWGIHSSAHLRVFLAW